MTGIPDDKSGSRHVESLRKMDNVGSEPVKGWDSLTEDANLATEDEHNTTFLQGLKRYPKACAWSAVVSLCIIMDGYDTALMGSLFAFPAFQQRFGVEDHATRTHNLDAQWQVALGMAVPVGNIFGITLNANLTERFGHKKVLVGALIALSGLITLQFRATSIEMLFAGQILSGVPWGMFTTMAPTYSSEVAPLVLRSYLETWGHETLSCAHVFRPESFLNTDPWSGTANAMYSIDKYQVVCCWGVGQFFSYAVLYSLNDRMDDWAYRIPFAVQWIWPAIIIPLALFCPESPWWLIRKGREEQALKSLVRLSSDKNKEVLQENAKKTVALMIETNRLEQDIDKGTSWLSCFTGTDLWRTEIAAVAWGIQVTSGFVIQGYATWFFQQAGLSADNSFKMTLGIGGIHLVCNIGSAALSGNYGRRSLFISGLSVLTALMCVIGALSIPQQSIATSFATSAVYLVWFGVWCLTIGPLPYVINGEVSSTRLRSKTIAIARGTYLVGSIINSVTTPFVLSPTAGNWKGKTGFLTAGLTLLSLVWAYFRLPETGGRTFEELDILFAEKHITARTFKKAVIERGPSGTVRVTGPHVRDT